MLLKFVAVHLDDAFVHLFEFVGESVIVHYITLCVDVIFFEFFVFDYFQ